MCLPGQQGQKGPSPSSPAPSEPAVEVAAVSHSSQRGSLQDLQASKQLLLTQLPTCKISAALQPSLGLRVYLRGLHSRHLPNPVGPPAVAVEHPRNQVKSICCEPRHPSPSYAQSTKHTLWALEICRKLPSIRVCLHVTGFRTMSGLQNSLCCFLNKDEPSTCCPHRSQPACTASLS